MEKTQRLERSFIGITLSEKITRWPALFAFNATVILIPARYSIELMGRAVPPVYRSYTDFLLFASDIAMSLTLILWALSLLFSPRKLTLGPRHIWIPLAGLTLAGGVSILSSYDRALSIYHVIRLAALFIFYVFIVNEIRSVVWVLIPVGIQVATQSAVGLAQFIAQRSVNLQMLGEFPLNPSWAGISVVIANSVRLLRAYGLSDHPNILGGCLAFGLILLLAAYLKRPMHPALLAGFLPALPALLVTFSRSAWLAFLAGAMVLVGAEMFHRRWDSIKPLLWLILISMVLLAPIFIAYARFFGVRLNAGNSFNTPSAEQQSIGERALLINYAAPIFKSHLLTGVGLGASPLAFKAYYPNFPVPYEPPHLTLVDSALETGILGFIFYLALLVFPFIIAIRGYKSLLSNPLTLAALTLLLSVTIVGFFDYYTWLLVPGRLWQWLAWGLWAAALTQAARSNQSATQDSSNDS